MVSDEARSVSGSRTGTRTLLGATWSTTLSVAPPFLAGSLLPFMRDELGVDASRMGLLIGFYFAAGAIAAIPGGRLAERLAPKRALLVANSLTAASMLAIGVFATSWIQLGLALGVAGWANGMLQPAGNLALMRGVTRRRQGLAFGIKQSAGPVATMLAGLAIPTLALTVGWRFAFIAAALPLPVIAWVLPTDERVTRRRERPVTNQSTATLVRIAVGAAFGFAAATTVGSFFVEGVVADGGRPGVAATMLIVASLTCVAVRLLVGLHSDRALTPSMSVVAALMGLGALGFGLLVISGSPWLWGAGGVVALGFGWGWPGSLHHAVSAANPDAPAAASGFATIGIGLGAVVGPPVFGFLAENASFSVAWGFSAALGAIGGAVLLDVHRRDLRSPA